MSWISLGVGVAGGVAQIIAAGKKKKEKALEQHAENAPQYAGSKGIDQYFAQAEQMANTAAEQTAQYKLGQLQNQRNMASGLAGSNVVQGGQGLVSKLVQGTNDASMKNLVGAQQLKNQRFNQFGQAAQMKSAQDLRKFQINQQQPWETKYNILARKAAAAADQVRAGVGNISSSISGASTLLGAKWMKDKGIDTGYGSYGSTGAYRAPNTIRNRKSAWGVENDVNPYGDDNEGV